MTEVRVRRHVRRSGPYKQRPVELDKHPDIIKARQNQYVDWHHSLPVKPLSEIAPEDFEGWGVTTLGTIRGKHIINIVFNEDEDSRFFEVWEDEGFSEPIFDLQTAVDFGRKASREGLV